MEELWSTVSVWIVLIVCGSLSLCFISISTLILLFFNQKKDGGGLDFDDVFMITVSIVLGSVFGKATLEIFNSMIN